MRDLDVARNRTTDDQAHWVVWNIPATATGMTEGQPRGAQLPDGSFQISATGQVYRGPGAPATGPQHHYTFEIFALGQGKLLGHASSSGAKSIVAIPASVG